MIYVVVKFGNLLSYPTNLHVQQLSEIKKTLTSILTEHSVYNSIGLVRFRWLERGKTSRLG